MSRRSCRFAVLSLAVLIASTASADEVPATPEKPASPATSATPAMPEMTPEQQAEMELYMKAGAPGPQHADLAKAAGTYDMALKSWHEPDGPAEESTGTATRTMILEGRVLAEEVSSSMMGMPFTGHGMTGYDNVTGKYWSTWNDSMSTGIMVSEGTCDSEGACTFTGSMSDAMKKGPVSTRMVMRWTSPTVQVFEMHVPGRDGKEFKMMEIVYTKR